MLTNRKEGYRMVTIICIYNNEAQYHSFLVSSCELQKSEYQLIGIDNTFGKFKSAAGAYNSVLKDIMGDTVVFCHQDIAFSDEMFLHNIENELTKHPDTVVGLAGITDGGIVRSNLRYRKTNKFITDSQLTECEPVEAVDECFFGMKKETLNRLEKFNENLVPGWHLYAAEMCLRWKLAKGEVYALPEKAYHKECSGTGLEVDKNFIDTIEQLAKTYRKQTKKIYSSCYICPTNPFLRTLRLWKSRCGQKYRFLKKEHYRENRKT